MDLPNPAMPSFRARTTPRAKRYVGRLMENLLITFHLLIVIALCVVVLLQKSEGGALGIGGGSGGGSGGFFTGRGQTNLLTRTTAVLGTLFFITSLGLSVLSRYGTGSGSLIDSMAPRAPASSTAPAAPGSGSGGVLDQLKNMQNNNPPSAPSAPSLPVPGAPTPQK